MPFESLLGSDRVEFKRNLSSIEVEQLVLNPKLRVLQCSTVIEPHTWDLLNESLFTRRPDIELRIYGFYSTV